MREPRTVEPPWPPGVETTPIRPGTVFYLSTRRALKLHARGIVDDHLVFRWWNASKKHWQYEAEPLWLIEKFRVPKAYWRP